MAPNLLTLSALILSMSAVGLVLMYDTTLTQQVPTWVSIYSVVCMFLYQTLDAVDGKQARRTQSSSPLGQLFDHGCDGINTMLFIILLWQSFQRGPDWGFFTLTGTMSLAFFVAQWEEMHTHKLRTATAGIGVTERKSILRLTSASSICNHVSDIAQYLHAISYDEAR